MRPAPKGLSIASAVVRLDPTTRNEKSSIDPSGCVGARCEHGAGRERHDRRAGEYVAEVGQVDYFGSPNLIIALPVPRPESKVRLLHSGSRLETRNADLALDRRD